MPKGSALEKARKIRLLALDFDGVLTDNRVLTGEDGKESVFCSRSDGYGINHVAKKAGILAVVISIEKNPVVSARCGKLGIECFSGLGEDEKFVVLKKACERMKAGLEEVCYVGNDLPDIECMQNVGFSVAVADAEKEVLKSADYVTKRPGGRGAVREVCEYLAKAKSNKR